MTPLGDVKYYSHMRKNPLGRGNHGQNAPLAAKTLKSCIRPWVKFNDYQNHLNRGQGSRVEPSGGVSLKSKQEAPELGREGEDIVCSTWRHVAGVLAHRVKESVV